MGKKLEMVYAEPFRSYLRVFSNRRFNEFQSEEHHEKSIEIAIEARNKANSDACLTLDQQDLTGNLISKVGYEEKNYEGMARATAEIVMLVNSFRNECENCLNKDCETRDPEKPLKQS